MSKKYSIFLSVLFCAFIGGIGIVSLVLPRQEFSELENRYLQKPPTLSLSSLADGTFMKEAEDYTADHIVGRDFWVSLKSRSERLTGKQENNGAYFGREDTLINRIDTPDPKKLAADLAAVDTLAESLSIPVYFGLIPSAAAIWADRLPEGAPTADELGIISQLYQSTQTHTIDLADALAAHSTEPIYYHTDHHWTSLGAFYGGNAILEAMGMEPLRLEGYEKTTVSDQFYGTIFSSSGVRWLPPDSIDTYVPGEGVKVTNYFNGSPTAGSLYVPEKLEKKDKYPFFLGGNQPLCVIETQHTDAPKLLVVRDSYADSLAPFLTERFSELHLFDLRYNLHSVRKYAQEHDIDQVLVLYSFHNFATDKNLGLLAR